ncbi:hypothetical protein EVAR_57161_1 [Eumeta japonica]|uniref:Uncharacterized protein n=1 Tax=Eumeta variegata TaxID=151549 RepID=A0A4C1YUG3_EUMVA|nr:hypothetical protein EVAR_57161_1 [Eumeta japonica]
MTMGKGQWTKNKGQRAKGKGQRIMDKGQRTNSSANTDTRGTESSRLHQIEITSFLSRIRRIDEESAEPTILTKLQDIRPHKQHTEIKILRVEILTGNGYSRAENGAWFYGEL